MRRPCGVPFQSAEGWTISYISGAGWSGPSPRSVRFSSRIQDQRHPTSTSSATEDRLTATGAEDGPEVRPLPREESTPHLPCHLHLPAWKPPCRPLLPAISCKGVPRFCSVLPVVFRCYTIVCVPVSLRHRWFFLSKTTFAKKDAEIPQPNALIKACVHRWTMCSVGLGSVVVTD